MSRNFWRWAAPVGPLALLLWATLPATGQSQSYGTQNGEWQTYGGDLHSTRYSALDHINADNFNKLEVAWRFKTDSMGPRPEFNLQTTPLMVKGIVYFTAGTRRAVWHSTAPPARCCGCTARTKASAANRRPGSCLAAVSRTGPTAAKTGSFT